MAFFGAYVRACRHTSPPCSLRARPGCFGSTCGVADRGADAAREVPGKAVPFSYDWGVACTHIHPHPRPHPTAIHPLPYPAQPLASVCRPPPSSCWRSGAPPSRTLPPT